MPFIKTKFIPLRHSQEYIGPAAYEYLRGHYIRFGERVRKKREGVGRNPFQVGLRRSYWQSPGAFFVRIVEMNAPLPLTSTGQVGTSLSLVSNPLKADPTPLWLNIFWERPSKTCRHTMCACVCNVKGNIELHAKENVSYDYQLYRIMTAN